MHMHYQTGKVGTMQNLLKRAKIVSSNDALLIEDIRYLKMVL